MANGSQRFPLVVRILSSLVLLLLAHTQRHGFHADSLSAIKDGSANRSDHAYERGLAPLASNDLQTAEKAFREALQAKSADVRSRLGLADVALKRGQFHTVEQHLRQASPQEPRNTGVLRGWGRYFYSQKQYLRAEKSLKQAAAGAPTDALPLVDLADLYLVGLNEPALAVATYRSALVLDPANIEAHYGLGLGLAATHQSDAALAELESTLRLKPDFVQARLARGDLLLYIAS